jgi:hypothetical protein
MTIAKREITTLFGGREVRMMRFDCWRLLEMD